MPRRKKDTRKPAPTNLTQLFTNDDQSFRVEFTPETGGVFRGTIEQINALLTALGYHEIAVRRNMMSRTLYIEAKLTPLHCSPASETYWSM